MYSFLTYVFKGADNTCGFCLNTGPICEIYLLRHGDNATSIDMSKSRCRNLRKIKLKLAETFTEKQPCTNHPLLCQLCPRGAPPLGNTIFALISLLNMLWQTLTSMSRHTVFMAKKGHG
jgi:hypothetical protein